MAPKVLATLSILGLSAVLASCSGGGGGGSSPNVATGPLSVPGADCGGHACISSSSGFMALSAAFEKQSADSIHTMAVPKENVLNFASLIYTEFQERIIPGINAELYRVEQVANGEGLKTCQDIATAADDQGGSAMGYPLGDGFTVDISAGDRTAPSSMSVSMMTKKFIFRNSSTAFAEVQIRCDSATEKTLYVRLKQSDTKVYEFWTQSDTGAKRVIIGAIDDGTKKYSFYFNTADGNTFQLHGVAINAVVAGAQMSFTIGGGANLTASKADIGYTQDPTISFPGSPAVPHEDGVDGAPGDLMAPRYCYTNLDSVTIDGTGSACSELLTGATDPGAIRSGTAWTLNGMGVNPSQSIATTF